MFQHRFQETSKTTKEDAVCCFVWWIETGAQGYQDKQLYKQEIHFTEYNSWGE